MAIENLEKKTAKQLLKPKVRKFAEAYFETGNATEAAKMAGYSLKSARVTGGRLKRTVAVQEYLHELREPTMKSLGLTVDKVLTDLKAIAEKNKDKNPMVSVRALELIGRNLGAFDSKVSQSEEKLQFVGIEITSTPVQKESKMLHEGDIAEQELEADNLQKIIDVSPDPQSDKKPGPAQAKKRHSYPVKAKTNFNVFAR